MGGGVASVCVAIVPEGLTMISRGNVAREIHVVPIETYLFRRIDFGVNDSATLLQLKLTGSIGCPEQRTTLPTANLQFSGTERTSSEEAFVFL